MAESEASLKVSKIVYEQLTGGQRDTVLETEANQFKEDIANAKKDPNTGSSMAQVKKIEDDGAGNDRHPKNGGRFFSSPLSICQRPHKKLLKKANSCDRFPGVDNVDHTLVNDASRYDSVKHIATPRLQPRNVSNVSPRRKNEKNDGKTDGSKERSPRERLRVEPTSKHAAEKSGFVDSFSGMVKFPINHRPRRGSRDDLDLTFRPRLSPLHYNETMGRGRPNSALLSPRIGRRRFPSDSLSMHLPPIGGGNVSRSPSVSPRSPRAFLQPFEESPQSVPQKALLGNLNEADHQKQDGVRQYIDFCIKTYSPQLDRKVTMKIVPEGSDEFQKILENLDDEDEDDDKGLGETSENNKADGLLQDENDDKEVKAKTNRVHFSDTIEINGKVMKSPDSTPNLSRRKQLQINK